MAKYLASAGIRRVQGSSNSIATVKTFPYIVLIGPSGQFVQVHGPSGQTTKEPDFVGNLQAYEQTFNHRALAWLKNEIVIGLRLGNLTTGANYQYAWQPYGQQDSPIKKINSSTFTPLTGLNIGDRIMFDGFNFKQFAYRIDNDGAVSEPGFLRIPGGGIFWIFPERNNTKTMVYGVYKGEDPFFKIIGIQSGWQPKAGEYSNPGQNDSNFRIGSNLGADNSSIQDLAGIEYIRPTTISDNINDIVYHKGTIYVAQQYSLFAYNIGGKGNYIFNDIANDDKVNDTTPTASYTSRKQNNTHEGSVSRSLATHTNGNLYMLSNQGKVYQVLPGKAKLVADLTTMGTPWSSGIIGGSLAKSTSSTWVGSTNARRCLMVSFNNQLHAFLNFQSTFRIAKGVGGSTGKGIVWATSHDGINWADRSEMLPSSGIIPPSGALSEWLSVINPYRFSGRVGSEVTPYPSGYPNGGVPARPSGFFQSDSLPFWSSGVLIDDVGTSFSSLKIPLSKGPQIGHVFPTFVTYPQGWTTINGAPTPTGTGASGYDYTGCGNYHISGFTDEEEKTLKIIFTENLQGRTLYYELDQASGWHRRNEILNSNQLNGLIPVDLYGPEIIIPSGTIFDLNPEIDEVNKLVKIKYKAYGWPFFPKINVRAEYSIDNGASWNHIGKHKNIDTGPRGTDPSGVLGKEFTFLWHYDQDPHPLSKHSFYPSIQIRLRGEEI